MEQREKKICYIDMDGVIANFARGMEKIAPHIPLGDGDDYVERSRLVHEACLNCPDIFLHLEPIEQGIETVIELMEHFDILFLSTPMDTLDESYSDKRRWIRRHFGELGDNRLILTPRKNLNEGHFLVDDTTRNGADKFKGEHIHFGTEKFPDWKTVLDYLISRA